MRPSTGRASRRGGFSLAELMVVIVIIGLLVTLVARNVMANLAKAQDTKVKADISTIMSALTEYAINNASRYPESLEVLVTPDEKGHTYINADTIPTDPWGTEYQYEPPGPGLPRPVILSLGKDGTRGGEGDDSDISSEDLRS